MGSGVIPFLDLKAQYSAVKPEIEEAGAPSEMPARRIELYLTERGAQ